MSYDVEYADSYRPLYDAPVTTMLTFRADDELAAALDAEAASAGVSRSDLLQRAVRELLYRLRCERDAEIYGRIPLTRIELAGWEHEVWPDADDGADWSEVFGDEAR